MLKTVRISLLVLISFIVLVSCNNKNVDIVYKDVNLIPMTGEIVVESISVHISEGKIAQIGEFSGLELPDDVQVIDGTGKYLTPGFSDMHVHTDTPDQLDLFIANGVTTIRNMWGSPEHLKAKKAIENKKIIGPELFTTGPLIDGKNAFWPGSLILDKKEDVEDVIKSIKSDGYDFIKVYDKLKPEVYQEIIRVAKEIDIPVVGHVPYLVGLTKAIEAGQQSIEHFSGYKYSYNVNDIKEKEATLTIDNGIWNCPTIIVLKTYRLLQTIKKENIPELKYIDPETVKWWNGMASFGVNYERAQEFVYNLHNRGGLIVSGTDVNNPYVIAGFSLHDEFQLLNEAGLTPYEVLLTTTVNPSRMLGISDRAGTIEVGKDADLVLLDKNPLVDISNTKTIAGVMSKGRWLTRKKLDEMLKNIADKISNIE